MPDSAVARYTALKKLHEQLQAQCERQRGAVREQRRRLRQRVGNLKQLGAQLRRRQQRLQRQLEKLAADEAAFRQCYGKQLEEQG